MIATWKQYEGQAVDGIPLLRLLGASEASAVYLGELSGEQCAIKLVPAEEASAQIPLARWQQASKLSHPHVTRIIQWGRARLDGRSLVYLVMEFAEEVLAEVDRPLTPKETREMLTPAVAGLAYIHSKGLAHGRVKPSNILSVNDVLKLSGDAPLKFGEKREGAASTPYDPPELDTSGVTAAGDVWSLGVTLVEALTRELPVIQEDEARLPNSLRPDTFREVATGCLQRDPSLRWTIDDLTQWLERGIVPAPKRAKRNYWLPAALAAGLLIAGLISYRYLTGSSGQPSQTVAANAVASTTPPAAAHQVPEPQQPAPTPPAEPPPAPVTKPIRTKPQTDQPVAAAVPPPEPAQPKEPVPAKEPAGSKEPAAQAKETPPDTTVTPNDKIPPDVVQPVKPDVTAKVRATIHGKVPITVRVQADSTGAVTEAKVESGGSSKYFADLSLKAARQWKFAPSSAPHVWLVRFEFTHSTANPVSAQATQIQ